MPLPHTLYLFVNHSHLLSPSSEYWLHFGPTSHLCWPSSYCYTVLFNACIIALPIALSPRVILSQVPSSEIFSHCIPEIFIDYISLIIKPILFILLNHCHYSVHLGLLRYKHQDRSQHTRSIEGNSCEGWREEWAGIDRVQCWSERKVLGRKEIQFQGSSEKFLGH